MKLHWRLFVNAKSEDKARRVVDRFKKALRGQGRYTETVEADLTIQEIKPYKKDKIHYKVEAETDIGAYRLPGALLRTLSLCNRVAHSWHITGPHLYSDGWEFELSADSKHQTITVPGLITIFCFTDKARA
jgi:hypothetical protein